MFEKIIESYIGKNNVTKVSYRNADMIGGGQYIYAESSSIVIISAITSALQPKENITISGDINTIIIKPEYFRYVGGLYVLEMVMDGGTGTLSFESNETYTVHYYSVSYSNA
jgi:hypothetical protein